MGGIIGGFDGGRFDRRGLGWGGLDGGCGFDGGCGCGGDKKIRVITAVRAVCASGDFDRFDWL
jgi:hypothetical protein